MYGYKNPKFTDLIFYETDHPLIVQEYVELSMPENQKDPFQV